MNTQTTITLGSSLSFTLAEICAQKIHAELIRRHLKRIGYADRHDFKDRGFDDVCRAVRSIPDTDRFGPRREFTASIKFYFKALRDANRTEPRWQDYVRRVAAFNGMPAPADADDPAWETFVLKQPHRRDVAA